jgi:hypothetical protein
MKFTLISLLLLLLCAANEGRAGQAEKGEKSSLLFHEKTTAEAREALRPQQRTPVADAKVVYVYNAQMALVYEAKAGDDARLKQLLTRSDLMMNMNSSSYYLLTR